MVLRWKIDRVAISFVIYKKKSNIQVAWLNLIQLDEKIFYWNFIRFSSNIMRHKFHFIIFHICLQNNIKNDKSALLASCVFEIYIAYSMVKPIFKAKRGRGTEKKRARARFSAQQSAKVKAKRLKQQNIPP